jgi:hypothetical protein
MRPLSIPAGKRPPTEPALLLWAAAQSAVQMEMNHEDGGFDQHHQSDHSHEDNQQHAISATAIPVNLPTD